VSYDPASFKNALLSRLGATDLASLRLQAVDLRRNQQLARRGIANEHVHFLDSGIASIIAAPDSTGHPVEIAMVGREGAIGLSAITGSAKAPYDTSMLLAGSGWRAPAEAVASAFHAREAVRMCILECMHAFLTQVSAAAAANARNKSQERLARWLLMAHDRAGGDELAVTHDVVARMLSVRRAGVSIALKHLEGQGLIAGRRGAIQILDRQGLVARANGAFTSVDEDSRQQAA
jgi:CRP-like cAMP-binding protein